MGLKISKLGFAAFSIVLAILLFLAVTVVFANLNMTFGGCNSAGVPLEFTKSCAPTPANLAGSHFSYPINLIIDFVFWIIISVIIVYLIQRRSK